MKVFDNVNEIVRDDMANTMTKESKSYLRRTFLNEGY